MQTKMISTVSTRNTNLRNHVKDIQIQYKILDSGGGEMQGAREGR